MSDWISVTERLPAENQRCLIYGENRISVGTFVNPIWYEDEWDRAYGYPRITHWMGLPEAPRESNSKRWTVCFPDGKERDCSFTLDSPKVNGEGGWETDGGCDGYGLSYEMSAYICEILNQYGNPEKERKLPWQSRD